MSILVTGGTGFLGGHLVHLLVEQGEKVRVLVRQNSSLENIKGLEVEKVTGDLRDPESLEKAAQGCHLAFHVAADYRLWAPDPKELYDSNVKGTNNFLTACQKAGVNKVVVTSSVATIGIPKDGSDGNEETPSTLDDMIGHYKRSKFLAEKEALKFAENGYNVICVNPSTPIGERDIKPTATGKIITDFLNGKMPAYVQTGLNLADVRDVAQGHILAAKSGQPGQRYILGGTNYTLKEIFDTLGEISGIPSPKIEIPLWFAYIVGSIDTFVCTKILRKCPRVPLEGVKMARKLMFFSSQKAKDELGYNPGPCKPALERAVKWFIDNNYAPRPKNYKA